MSETVDLRKPEEIARLRHFLRSALNNIVGYADVVRRQAEEQGARAAAGIMEQVAAAGREGIEIVRHLLPVKSHVSESAVPMLRSHLAPRVERIQAAVASFEAKTRGACASEVGKMRLALQDLAEFQRGIGRTRPAPAPGPAPKVFEMTAAGPDAGSARRLPCTSRYALVVDNDDAIRDELGRLLQAAGLKLVAEARPGAALERLRREPFDLVLLDLDAAEMLAELRANPGLGDVPVLVLARPDQHEAMLRALEMGADDFISKPIDAVVLRARVRGILRLRQKLSQAENVGALAGTVARDLHELLDAIVANISLVREALPASNPNSELLATTATVAERASGLTRELAAFAGKGAGAWEPVNISEAVQEIGDLLRASLPKHVRLRMPFTQGLPAVPADPRQIQQLVFLLVANAGEAIGAQEGTVTVETGLRYLPQGAPAAPPFGGLSSGHYVYVSVHDTGCGIDEATRPRIFEPFFSTRSAGRGMGLSAAMTIARAHGGVIHLQTEPGRGSRFEVLLPAKPSAGD